MPAAPDREDDEAQVAPTRSEPAGLRAVRSSEDWSPADPVRTRHPVDAREARGPALEGLTTTGAAVVGLFGATLGAVLDVLVSPGLGWIFFPAFLVMSAFVGLRLRRRDAWATLGVPPQVFIAAAGISAQVGPATTGSWVERTSAAMATAVLDHPYVLLIGTALAVLAFAYRALID